MDSHLHGFELVSGLHTMTVNRNGGRIASFSCEGKNALVTQGVQTGSTFWPSPQSLWSWPPPTALDQAPYKPVRVNDREICLQSPRDTHLGVQLTKSISPIVNGFNLTYTLCNISNDIVTMAPWEISRVPGGLTFYAAQTQPEPQSTCDIVKICDHYWYNYNPKGLKGIPKVFANNSHGWLANLHDNMLFLKRFPRIPTVEVAPGEAEVEIYAHADTANPYVEIEQQGAFRAILPGMRNSWSVDWLMFELPGSVLAYEGSPTLIAFVEDALRGSSSAVLATA